MNSGNEFSAPWSTSLRLITLLSTGVLLSLPLFALVNNVGDMRFEFAIVIVLLPVTILVISAFFMIRGYEVRNNVLHIQRLGWRTTLDLVGLESAETDPEAMKGSIRLFGNGGLFCFAGKFRNKKLGSYRAFATDRKLAVVLKFRNKVVVVTPDKPVDFCELVKPEKRHR